MKTIALAPIFLVWLFAMPPTVQAAADGACKDPYSQFNLEIKTQLESLRALFIPTQASAEGSAEREKFIAKLSQDVCSGLVNNTMDSVRAIAGLRTLRLHVLNCRSDGAVAVHLEESRDSGRYGMLAYNSAQQFCTKVEKLRSFSKGTDYIFLDDYVKAGGRFGEELFCTLDILYDVPDFMPIIGKDLREYPPRVKFVEAMNVLCEELKSGEKNLETVRREFERAKIEAYGSDDIWQIFPFISYVAKNNFGEALALPALFAGGLSLLACVICFPLWILTILLVRLDPGRYLWDDLTDLFAGVMGTSFVVFSILSLVVYADSLVSFLEGVAVFVGIIASVLGIILGFKKLMQPQKTSEE